MAVLSMIAEGLSMVGGDGTDGVLIHPVLPQLLHKAADNRVRVGDLAIVRLRGIVSLERLRRVIRVVSIVEMQPDEKRPLLMTAQPAQRAVGNILRAPLPALLTVLSSLALLKLSLIHVEATLEAQSTRCRVENIGAQERRRVISVMV